MYKYRKFYNLKIITKIKLETYFSRADEDLNLQRWSLGKVGGNIEVDIIKIFMCTNEYAIMKSIIDTIKSGSEKAMSY